MDEASSRFVDKIVMDKIVSEKLSQVCHAPEADIEELSRDIYKGFDVLSKKSIEIVHSAKDSLLFKSPIESAFPENSEVPVKISLSESSKAKVILVHGLFEENRDIYTYLIKNLNRFGYDIYQTTLPFHYERTPSQSLFSGEYFWSANIQRSRFAFNQSVTELFQLYKYLKAQDSAPVYIVSFSMGGGVAQSLMSLTDELDKVFLLNPTCSLSAIVWDSPLCQTIKNDLIKCGWSLKEIIEIYSHFDPATLLSKKDLSAKTAIGYGIYDMITQEYQYKELIAKLRFTNNYEYHSGHLNLLRVPKLGADIHAFFSTEISQKN